MSINRLGIVTDAAGARHPRHSAAEKKLVETIKEDNNVVENFDSQLLWSAVDKEGGLLALTAPAAGDEVVFSTRKNRFEHHVMSINGTPVQNFSIVTADGLKVGLDADVTNGITGLEIGNGILPSCAIAQTVGENRILFEVVIKVADISDVTELWAGVRKAEAYRADPDDYDEMAAFNIGKDADGQIEIHTILNGGATSETDTTLTDWADAGEHTLKLIVNLDGGCEWYFDGERPTVSPRFVFDANEVLVPFIAVTNETGDPEVTIPSWKFGKL